jgi:parallel beta-helix repeat protein
MNKKAIAPQIFLAILLITAGIGILFISVGKDIGLTAITGLPVATSTSCGDVIADLTLTAGITIPSGEICFNMTTDDVVLNCAGNTIDGDDTAGSIAFFANGTNNVTITNCTVTDAYYGILMNSSHNMTSYNNVFSSNTRAIQLQNSNHAEITRNNFTGNGFAVVPTANDLGLTVRTIIRESVFNQETSEEIPIGASFFTNITNSRFNTSVSISSSYPFGAGYQFINNTVHLYGPTYIMCCEGNPSNSVFKDNEINYTTGTSTLITQYNADSWRVENNIVYGGSSGTFYFARGAYNQTAFNNTVYRTNAPFVHWISFTGSARYIRNRMFSPTSFGIQIVANTNHDLIENNTINNTPIGIHFARDTSFGDPHNNTARNNTITNSPNTVYADGAGQNQLRNQRFKVSRIESSTIVASIDFNVVSRLNISRNISLGYSKFILGRRIAALDPNAYPSLNKSANISYKVGLCSPFPEIRHRKNFTGLNKITTFDENCTSLTTPSCTNIVCGGQKLNFSVEHFTTYATLPACTTPTPDDVISTETIFCPGNYSLSSGFVVSQDNLDISCNSTVLNGPSGSGTVFDLSSRTNDTIRDCFIHQFNIGVSLGGSVNNTIFNNTFNNTGGTGVSVGTSSLQNLIKNNTFFNAQGNCIQFAGPNLRLNNITNNVFFRCGATPGTFTGALFSQGSGEKNVFRNNIFANSLSRTFVWSNSGGGGIAFIRNNFTNNSGNLAANFCFSCQFIENRVVNSGSLGMASNATIRNNLFNGSQLVIGSVGGGDALNGPNSTALNNTFMHTSFGITVAEASGDSLIYNNTFINVTQGVLFQSAFSNATGNVFIDVDVEFNSTVSDPNFLINQFFRRIQNNGVIFFGNVTFNFTNGTNRNIIIKKDFVSVNSSNKKDINKLNRTSNVSMQINGCPVSLIKKTGFPRTRQEILDGGVVCPDCTNVVCGDNRVNFTVGSFSGIASAAPTIRAISPNATNQTQTIGPDNTSVNITVKWNTTINFTVNATHPSEGTLTFSWFVDQVLQFVETLTGTIGQFIKSVFNFAFLTSGRHNVTVVVNGTNPAENDTFTFRATVNGPVPNITTVFLNSTFGTNLTRENLTVYVNTSDLDSATIINITDWRINGSSIAVLNLPFESSNESATFTKDYSTLHNNGTVIGPTFTEQGKIGGAYLFDQAPFTDNFLINVSSRPSLENLSRFTVELWINASQIVAPTVIMSKQRQGGVGPGPGNPGFKIGFLQTFICSFGKIGFQTKHYDGSLTSVCSDAAISTGKWILIDAVHNGTNLILYVDGVRQAATATTDGNATYNHVPVSIGACIASCFENSFNGTIDEVRIYNRTLSAAEIVRHNGTDYTTIVSQETTIGERWQAAVTANDGDQDSITRISNNVTIVNGQPTVLDLVLNSTRLTNYSDENLTAYWSTTDADGDTPIVNITDWRINGTSITLLNAWFERSEAHNATDYSIFNNTPTITNVRWFSDRGHLDSGAYNFTNTAGFVDYGTGPATMQGNQTTLMAWVYWRASDEQFDSIFNSWNQGAGDHTIFSVDGSGNLHVFIVTPPCSADERISTSTIIANQWTHVAFSRKGALNTFYIDGVAAGTDATLPTGRWFGCSGSFVSMRIGGQGADHNNDARYFDGYIDDPRIYNTSLSVEQIREIARNRTDVIVKEETTRGELWHVAVTLNDGIENGFTVLSNNITIVNKPSNITAVYINSSRFLNRTNENLTAYWNLIIPDADGDRVINITDWRIDGTSIALLNMPFESGSNTTFTRDYSTFRSSGNVTSILWNRTGGFDSGGAYEFDGSGAIHSNASLPTGARNKSVFVRFKTPASPDRGWLFSGGESCIDGSSFGLFIENSVDDKLRFFGCGSSDFTIFGPIQADMWYDVIISYDGTNVSAYVNGVLNTSQQRTLTTSKSNFSIGHRIGTAIGDSDDFEGFIDQIIMFNRSLSAEQVLMLNKTFSTISSKETKVHERWQAAMTPDDGYDNGTTVLSNNITILNVFNITKIYPNGTGLPQNITIEANVTIIRNATFGRNQTFNVTIRADPETFTFRWFVNGVLRFIEVVTNGFTSMFNYIFNLQGRYNVTVQVNGSREDINDTFSFLLNIPCIVPSNGANITNSTLFCPGIFNLEKGINANRSDIVLLCNNTVFNGTGINNGITVDGFSNVSIYGCGITRYDVGIQLTTTGQDRIINATIASCPNSGMMFSSAFLNIVRSVNISHGSRGITVNSGGGNNITNNRIFNTSNSIMILGGTNNIFDNNTLVHSTTEAFFLPSVSGVSITNNHLLNGTIGIRMLAAANSNNVSNNVIANFSSRGITLDAPSVGPSNNVFYNNTFLNNSIDIFAQTSIITPPLNKLVVLRGSTRLSYRSVFTNVSDIDNLFVNDSLVAVNASIESSLNVTANITVNVASCPATIMSYGSFTRNPAVVAANGQICNMTTSPSCHNVTCSAPILSFNVNHFSSYAASDCFDVDGDGFGGSPTCTGDIDCNDNDATIRPPANDEDINQSVIFCPGTFNIVDGIDIFSTGTVANITVQCNGTTFNQTLAFSATAVEIASARNISVIGCRFVGYTAGGFSLTSVNDSEFITNQVINSSGGNGFFLSLSNNNNFTNNTVRKITSTYAIQLDNSDNNTFVRNNITSTSGGILLGGFGETSSHRNIFIGNDVRNSGQELFYAEHGSSGTVLRNNKFINGSFGVYIGFTRPSNDSVVVNNTIHKIRDTTFSDALWITGRNNLAENNTISNATLGAGIHLEQDTNTDVDPQNNTIRYNRFFNNRFGIEFETASNNTVIDPNITKSFFADIRSKKSPGLQLRKNILILREGSNRITFHKKVINLTNISNIFINTSLVAVNTSIERVMNTTANVTFGVNSCTDVLFKSQGFFRSVAAAQPTGASCTTCSTPVCAANLMSFSTTEFSTIFAAPGPAPPTPPSGGGGTSCTPSVSCGAWSSCTAIGAVQSRTCNDGCSSPYTQTKGCTCVNECTSGALECVSSSKAPAIRECSDYNGDGCTEWLITNYCSVGDTCGAGSCIAPVVVPPVVEVPSPVVETSIAPSALAESSLACVLVNKTEVTTQALKTLSESPYYEDVAAGFDTLVSAFSVSCVGSEFTLNFAIPDNYVDVQALRCRAGRCSPVEVTEIQQLFCGQKLFKDVSRQTEYLDPALFPISVTPVETKEGDALLESNQNKIHFVGDVKGSVSLLPSPDRVREADNPGIKIVGTPIVLSFTELEEGLGTEITVPYVLEENIDEYSISLYARKDDRWTYLGGVVNTTTKTVTANISNIAQYAENNKVTLAPMGVACLTCLDTEFVKVYEGRSRDAVILVHGFENSPARFEDIINDIRLTNQPWQAWTFGYPSHQTIEQSAKEFADLVEAHIDEFDYISIAAHSMGGIITQQMLRYAYEENLKNPGAYTFLKKVNKVIIIAAPNKGSLSRGVYEDLFDFLLNNKVLQGIFNLNSMVLQELIEGRVVERVPGLNYYVIAGTRPFDFTRDAGVKNDGLVAVDSAQTIGNSLVANKCQNYWELDVTHTDILNNYDSRRVVERIVAQEVSELAPTKAVLGYSQYFSLAVDDCSPDDQYLIIGKPITEEETASPGLCACGNNVCGIDENILNCPSDCAVIRAAKSNLLQFLLHFKILQYLLGAILLIILFIFLVSRRHREAQVLLPISEDEHERLLNELLVQTRTNLRLHDYDHAAISYSHFSSEYSAASLRLQNKFKDVADKLQREVKRRIL